MFIELIDAIRSTQDALAEVRRDDGQLVNHVSNDDVIAKAVVDVIAKTQNISQGVAGIAANALESERNAQMFAQDAERCVKVMSQLVSEWNAIRELAKRAADSAQRSSDSVDMFATSAEDWANYSKAQADNAIAAKDESLQWAEYLAGPIVSGADAPDYIANSKFPGGYFYQSVDGGVAGLWSAKWWALQARAYTGSINKYYLGAFDSPPLPGEQNPTTGLTVPDPIPTGSLYYDNTSDQLLLWNGTAWTSPVALTASFQARYVYVATAGQTTFSGADFNGQTPVVGGHPSDVHLNGVKLLPDEDYDIAGDELTINTALRAGDIVQWDLLVSASDLAPGAVNAFKILPLTPNGTAQDFTLQYADPDTSAPTPANVGDSVELLVSLDGCVQEPGIDFTASGSSLHLAQPPSADAALWAVWYQPAPPAAATSGGATMYTLKYNAKTISQAVADPGNTFVSWNTVAQADATKLCIAARTDTNIDAGNFWRQYLIDKFIALQRTNDANQIQHFVVRAVIDHTTWFEVSVQPLSASGDPFDGNNPMLVGVY